MGLFSHKKEVINTSSIKTVVCPNCGAAVTNFENCEYCGSFLVRFIEQNIAFDSKSYLEDDTNDFGNYKISEFLDFQLSSINQSGINGTRTHFAHHPISSLVYQFTDTVAYVADGKYLQKFNLRVPTPFMGRPSEFIMAKRDPNKKKEEYGWYELPLEDFANADFVLVVPFIDYSSDSDVNSQRAQLSRNQIMASQLYKRAFLNKCDFAKLMTPKTIYHKDYTFELYIMNLGHDIKGAASVVLQLAAASDGNDMDFRYYDSNIFAEVETL